MWYLRHFSTHKHTHTHAHILMVIDQNKVHFQRFHKISKRFSNQPPFENCFFANCCIAIDQLCFLHLLYTFYDFGHKHTCTHAHVRAHITRA